MMQTKNGISLAQWALVNEIKSGQWKTLDFPAVARKDFNLDAIEFVNTLFEVPTMEYLNTLKRNADDNGVQMILIMVDDEGDAAAATEKERRQYVINHKKWIDIAHYLGCSSIRTNCRGVENITREDALSFAAETYAGLLEYSAGAGLNVLIENHGGVSDDADWMVALMEKVNHPLFGTYPDWREPKPGFDNYNYLLKTIPFAKGTSYRNQPDDALTVSMIELCKQNGYDGWYGIESGGRDAINKGIELLKRNL